MTKAEIYRTAAEKGRLRLVAMSFPDGSGPALWVEIDQDFDATFAATCADTGEELSVNGWLGQLHDDAEARLELAREYGIDWREQPAAIAATAKREG